MIYDAMLISVFADWQSLEAYKVYPEHKKVSAFCKSVRLSRAAVDLIID
ncbi:MAG: Dabb family protein [Acutalibacteraceae bacterium]